MNEGNLLAHEPPLNLFKTTLLEDIGLAIPRIASYIEKSGLRDRKKDYLPLSISEFEDFVKSLSKEELLLLQQALGPPKRVNFETDKQILSFDNVIFAYRNQLHPTLRNLSFTIKRGEFIAIIGNNGSGKSTLVKHVIGLNKPNTGAVIIDVEDTRKTTAAQLARKISFLFQNPDNQIFNATVLKEVKYAPENCKMPKQEAESRATAAIIAVGLGKYIEQNPLKLSMGQKQRVAVASALTMTPEIIVLDEPTTGQDLSSLKGIMNLMIKEYQTNTNIIMVTHDMDLVDQVANRVLVMCENKVVADDDTDLIYSKTEILRESNLKSPVRVQMLAIVNGC